jgi:hypothetical protein
MKVGNRPLSALTSRGLYPKPILRTILGAVSRSRTCAASHDSSTTGRSRIFGFMRDQSRFIICCTACGDGLTEIKILDAAVFARHALLTAPGTVSGHWQLFRDFEFARGSFGCQLDRFGGLRPPSFPWVKDGWMKKPPIELKKWPGALCITLSVCENKEAPIGGMARRTVHE